jgi:glycine cleavage system transcriptional repressor
VTRNALIVFATGRDRPGIVDRVTGLAYEAGANLEDSRMAILGGEFALIVLFTGGPSEIAKVERGMTEIGHELDLTMQFKPTTTGPEARRREEAQIPYRLHAVAIDHPGIVHKVTRVLARRGINVARLDTSVSNAPVTGAPIFSLDGEVEVPASVPIGALRAELRELAERENIDLDLHALD